MVLKNKKAYFFTQKRPIINSSILHHNFLLQGYIYSKQKFTGQFWLIQSDLDNSQRFFPVRGSDGQMFYVIPSKSPKSIIPKLVPITKLVPVFK